MDVVSGWMVGKYISTLPSYQLILIMQLVKMFQLVLIMQLIKFFLVFSISTGFLIAMESTKHTEL